MRLELRRRIESGCGRGGPYASGQGGALVIWSGVGVASVKEAFLSCGGESDHCFWGTLKNGVFKFSAAEEDAASEGGDEG